MLKGADLDKILNEGFGDAGFNDDVPEVEEAPAKKLPAPKAKSSAFAFPASAPGGAPLPVAAAPALAPAPAPAAAPAPAVGRGVKPADRPVLGAAPMPQEGVDPAEYEQMAAMDTAARAQGYRSAEELGQAYMESQSDAMANQAEEMQENNLAPGVRKAPAWASAGAYPGDKTKVGKDYQTELETLPDEGKRPDRDPVKEAEEKDIDITFVRQAEGHGARPQEGHTLRFRTGDTEAEGEETAVLGAGALPWALEIVARRLKPGDIAEVVARGEFTSADGDVYQKGLERRWRFEVLAVEGRRKDKFSLSADERIEHANVLRLKGNDMFKQGRLLKALDFYARGAALTDVLEPEELGGVGKPDKVNAAINKRIWACNQPLLLNWSLILMKFGCYREAERKCTEILSDIHVLCVKAIFRRGVCNVHLGNIEQARMDLYRARELDTSISREVERELLKVEQLQKKADKYLEDMAKKAVGGYLKSGDRRSSGPPAVAPPVAPRGGTLMEVLHSQETAAENDGTDKDSWCRQREAIYNSFLKASRNDDDDEDKAPVLAASTSATGGLRAPEATLEAEAGGARGGFCGRRRAAA